MSTSTTSTATSPLIQSSTGLGSGLNINSIVTQLVAAEGQPTYNRINKQESAINTRLSGLGTLKSALSTFQTAVNALKTGTIFQTNSATSSNSAILTVTPGTGSVAASHAIEVTHLAASQSSITTAEFANTAATVGTGTLTFTSAGSSFSLTVDSSNNSLVGLRDAINSASGNTSVSASIVNVDNAAGTGTISKLVLTAKNSGTANAFTVSGTDNDGNNTDNSGLSQIFSANLANQTTAADAVIKVDGQTATRSSNTISNVLQGVTLNLQSAVPGTTVNVGVSLNTGAISTAVNNFVNAYNTLHSTTASLGAYGGVGGANGQLFADPTLEYVTNQMRTLSTGVVSSATGGYNSLAMIGVSVDKTGVMSLDSTQLNKALSANVQSVSNVFSSSDGVATRLGASLSNMLLSSGSISSQTTSLNNQLAALEKQRAAEQRYLDSYQASLQKQYAAMDALVGKYNSTSSYLTSWIAKGA